MMKEVILVISSSSDGSVDTVISLLQARGEKYFRLDTDMFPKEIDLEITLNAGTLGGFLKRKGRAVADITAVKSCWYRGVKTAQGFRDLPRGYVRFIQEESKAALWSLYTNLSTFWMNHPFIGARLLESNKLYQLRAAANAGLRIPETIITNEPETLLSFCKKHGGIIAVKMMSPHVFLFPDREHTFYIYTQEITAEQIEQRIDAVRLAPILAQEYIRKLIELRATIVYDQIFTCGIHSQTSERTKHDWRRYDFHNVKHEIFQLPHGIQKKLFALMRSLGLTFGAVDMILTPENDFVFLEINPHGQWDWIEKLTGLPISNAIAETLANPPSESGLFVPPANSFVKRK